MTAPVDRAYVEVLPTFKNFNQMLKKNVDDGLRGVRQQLTSHTNEIGRSVESAQRMHMGRIVAMGTAVGTVAGQGIAAMARMGMSAVTSGIKTAAGMEQAQIAFQTLLHSATGATKFINDLKTFAAATPFEIPGLIDASRQLLGVGMKSKDVIPTLRNFGDAAGALGIQQDGFNRIMLATSQAMSAGTLHAGDLLQMTEAGLPVWSLLSKALGKPVTEIKKLSEEGKLMTKDVLPKLQAQMHKDYGGAMSKQSQTLSGLWSTLMDTFNQGMGDAIMPLEPMMRVVLPKATAALGNALKGVGTNAAQFLGGLSGHVKKMSQEDRPKLELFGLGIHALSQSFKDGDVTSKGFIGVMERIGVVLRKAVDWLKETGKIAVQSGRDIFIGLKGMWTAVGPIIMGFAGFMVKYVIPVVLQLARVLLRDLGTAFRVVGEFFAEHKVLIQSISVALITFFAVWKTYNLVVTAVNAIKTGIMALRLAMMALRMAFLANPFGLIIAAVAALVIGLVYAYKHSETFRNIVDKLGRSLRDSALTVGHFFQAVWDVGVKVFKWIGDIPNKINDFFAHVGSWLTDAGHDLLTGFLDGIKATWHFITEWFGKMLGRIGTAIGDVVKWASHVGSSLINAELTGLKLVWHFVTEWFSKMLSRIGTAIGDFGKWAKNLGSNFIQAELTGLKIVWHLVTEWFSKMLSWIGTAIGDAKKWASNIGGSIINGLLEGLKSVWNTVTDWFGKLPGWIKSALGIHSPPAWAVDAGSWIIKGLIKGFIGGSFSFTQFLKHFAGLAKNKLADWFGGGSASTGGLQADILNLLHSLRERFGNVPLISGFRANAHTLSGNLSRHAVGEAIDIPAHYDWTFFIRYMFGNMLRELISPWNNLNILYGRQHTFTGNVYDQHAGIGAFAGNRHTHVAYGRGGRIPEEIFGVGRSGRSYSFGERGRAETVVPDDGTGIVALLSQQNALLARLIDAVMDVAPGVGVQLNGSVVAARFSARRR